MGLIASFASAFLAASKDLISKRLAFRLDGTASTYASFAYALPFYLVLLAVLGFLGYETFSCSITFLVLVLLRSITDTLAEGMKMHALGHADISMVASFFSLSPLFLLITSPLITGDRLSLPGILAVIVVVAGSLLLVYRPGSASWATQKRGILLAVGAAMFFSLNSCFDRLAVQEGTPVLAGFAMTLVSAMFLFPLVIRNQRRLDALRVNRRGLVLRGFLEVTFMVSKLCALQFLQAPYVVGIQRLSMVLSIIGGRVFFGEEDFGRRLAAGTIILGGVILIALLQWL